MAIPPDENLKREIMDILHNHPLAGHPGRNETLKTVKEHYWWLGMNEWIKTYVQGCAICQSTKINTHKASVPMYKIPVPSQALPFQQVAMDLITGLPPIKGQDAILTIVDHGCSRAALFIPCSTTITGPEIASLYLDNVYRWFGLPTKIISDRDPRFTSQFGKALTKALNIGQNLSTAFHPQTDGLSECKNQWIEQYLRAVTAGQPQDWNRWLSIASAVHNNRTNSTIGLSPNEILIRYKVKLLPDFIIQSQNTLVEDRLTIVKDRRNFAIQELNKAAQNPHTLESRFKIGDEIWLEGTNLKLPYQSTKLAPKRYGPFKIIKEISPVAFQIKLPSNWKIHDVFYASLLSPYRETT